MPGIPYNDPSISDDLFFAIDAKDSASMGSPANGGSVTSWSDLSGNDRHLTYSGSGSAVYRASAFDGNPAVEIPNGGLFQAEDFFTSDTESGFSMFMVLRLLGNDAEPLWDGATSLWFKEGALTPQRFALHNSGALRAKPGFSNSSGLLLETIAGTNGAPYAANNPGNVDLNGASPRRSSQYPGSGRTVQIPRSGSIQVAFCAIYKRRLTHTERFGLLEWIVDRYDCTHPLASPTCGAIINVGNSTTAGGLSYGLAQKMHDLDCMWFNMGWSGGMTGTTLAQGPELMEMVEWFRDRDRPVLLTAHLGHNDAGVGGGESVIAQLENEGSTLWGDIRDTGAKVMYIGRTVWHNNSGREECRQTLNAWTDSGDWEGHVDFVSDALRDSPEFGVYGTGSSISDPERTGSWLDYPTLWSDEVHFTEAGYVRQAELLEDDLRDAWEATMDVEPDVTAPTITGATVPSAGTTVVLTASEAISPTSGITGFSVLVNGVSKAISSATASGSTITLTMTSAIYSGRTATYSYSPGNAADGSGNALAAIFSASAANNSTQTPAGGGSIEIAEEGCVPDEVPGGVYASLLLTSEGADWTPGVPGLPIFSASRGEILSQAVLTTENASVVMRTPSDSRPLSISAAGGFSATLQVRDSSPAPTVSQGQLVPLEARVGKSLSVDFSSSLTGSLKLLSASASASNPSSLESTYCVALGAKAVVRLLGTGGGDSTITVTGVLSDGSTATRSFMVRASR